MQSSATAVNRLNTTIGEFRSNIDGRMQEIQHSTDNIHQTTQKILDNVTEFRETMIKSEEVQLAHENVIRLDQMLKEQFGDYEQVRRTIIGVVRDFDINLVRNRTIQELSEELWLTSSRYWLSYALIAVSAWVNDFPEVADNALSEGTRRDPIKASLFFTLLNLRFGRNDAAKLWFVEYMKTLDPTFLQNEASVMIEAYLSGLFGRDPSLQAKVDATIAEWIAIVNENAQVSSELVNAYRSYVRNLSPQVDFSYGSIRRFCANAGEIEAVYREASKYALMLELVESLDVEDVEQNPENYAARVDAVLTSLITNFDQEERELRNQQEYYRLVIKNGGSVNVAEAQYREMIELRKEGFNIGRAMVNWVLYDGDDTDVHVRKFGLTHTKSWFLSAIEDFSNGLQARFPTSYRLGIDGWQGLSNGDDQTELAHDLESYFETNRFSMIYLNSTNIVAGIFAIVCIGLAFLTPWTLIGTLLGAAFVAWNVSQAIKAYPTRVQEAQDNLAETMREIADFKDYCDRADEVRDQVRELLEYGFVS